MTPLIVDASTAVKWVLPVRLAILALLAALPSVAAEGPAGLTAYQEQLARDVRELRALERASTAGVTLLDEVARAVPELLWLDEMTLRGGRARIRGRAYNTNAVAGFIEALDSAPGFDEPTLVSTKENPDSTFSFELAFNIDFTPSEEEGEGTLETLALERERSVLRHRLTRQEDVPQRLAELRALIERADIEVASFVEAPPGKDGGVPVDVEVTGATFHKLALFFDRLKRFSAFTKLDELTIRQAHEQPSGGTITASFRLSIPLRAP